MFYFVYERASKELVSVVVETEKLNNYNPKNFEVVIHC